MRARLAFLNPTRDSPDRLTSTAAGVRLVDVLVFPPTMRPGGRGPRTLPPAMRGPPTAHHGSFWTRRWAQPAWACLLAGAWLHVSPGKPLPSAGPRLHP